MIRQRFVVGDRVTMSDDALENYGEKYRDKVFVIESVSKKYMPASEFFAKGKPAGYHPGFDDSTNTALYEVESGFNGALYDWELRPARFRTHKKNATAGASRASRAKPVGFRCRDCGTVFKRKPGTCIVCSRRGAKGGRR